MLARRTILGSAALVGLFLAAPIAARAQLGDNLACQEPDIPLGCSLDSTLGLPHDHSSAAPRGPSAASPDTAQAILQTLPPASSGPFLAEPADAQTSIVDEVPLKEKDGVLVVPVQINGAITLEFVVDSGAADVQIPLDVFHTLVRAETIVRSDLTGVQTYVLADGSTQEDPRVVLRELKIGTRIFRNVPASVSPAAGSLLLGQSFLSRFPKWTIDNRQHLLRLVEKTTGVPGNLPSPAGVNVQQEPPTAAALPAEHGSPSPSAAAKIARLNGEVVALRVALDLSKRKDKAKGVQLADLGRRLNAALAGKAQHLGPYQSEFLDALRQALANQPGVQVVGDRFVVQDEVLFPIGSADLTPEGKLRIIEVALTLQQIAAKIPSAVPWVLAVEGFTDATPINTPQFPSNWALSAQRAINVVQLLIQMGIPPNRLVAVGFGDTHPLDPADTPAAYTRNRRIEFRLTDYY